MVRIVIAIALLAARLRLAKLTAPAAPAYVGRHWAPGVI
jgi:hypothetical protein